MDDKKVQILKSSTAYIIKNPGIQLYDLIDRLSTAEFKTEAKKPLAYIYDDQADIIRIPSGVGDQFVMDSFPGAKIEVMKYSPFRTLLS